LQRRGFISFEGGEGTGKSTQLRRLAERLRALGLEVVATREPGGSPAAEAIRGIILSGRAKPLGALGEAYLFAAARIDHVAEIIAPALARGAFVLVDRFIDSTRVYQGGSGGVPAETIAMLEAAAVGALRPDLTLVLDLSAELALERVAGRGGEGEARFDGEPLALHQARREAFLALAAAEPERCVVVDASGDAEDVAARIWDAVAARFDLPERAAS
jgi:dTMP kinase